jgi:prolyl-tRNA editing enzyme YbaK/EbsC (Cys-tRNA(Pro) deacylase)
VPVKEITNGVLPGGVPPLGNLFGLEVYADNGLLGNEKIVFNAGDRSYSVAMRSKDYIDLVKPVIGSFV